MQCERRLMVPKLPLDFKRLTEQDSEDVEWIHAVHDYVYLLAL
jgi:hypothetical protein